MAFVFALEALIAALIFVSAISFASFEYQKPQMDSAIAFLHANDMLEMLMKKQENFQVLTDFQKPALEAKLSGFQKLLGTHYCMQLYLDSQSLQVNCNGIYKNSISANRFVLQNDFEKTVLKLSWN